MPYNTTGNSHSEGVQNEKNIVDFLNFHNDEDPLNVEKILDEEGPLTYEQRGGTQEVSDMVVKGVDGSVLCGVSMKKHRVGTYDYVNTTRLGKYLPPGVVSANEEGIRNVKEEYAGVEGRVDEARERVAEMYNDMFKHMDSDNITSLLKAINHRNPALVLVTDESERKLKLYHESAFEELAYWPYKSGQKYTLKETSRAKTSRQVMRNGVKTDLRVRITLNNGVRALLGLSNSNRSSSTTIKVQQDNVDEVLRESDMWCTCDY
jgi:hypothetical protein